MSYDNNMSGVLFPNKDKEGQQPDYRGECEINGKKYEIAGWKKMSNKGNAFLSMKFQEPRKNQAAPEAKPSKRDAAFDGMPNDIPF